MSRRRLIVKRITIVAACVMLTLTLSVKDEVDINSGRIRQGVYLLGVPLLRYSSDSALTQALSPDREDRARVEWRAVMSSSFFMPISPHYSFHLARSQINQLRRCWELADFSPEAKRACSKRVLRLWEEHDRYFETGNYLQALWVKILDSPGERFEVEDLPPAVLKALDQTVGAACIAKWPTSPL